MSSSIGAQRVPSPIGYDTGVSSTIVVGGLPLSISAVYTYALNDEPGWRCACHARLNWFVSENGVAPPTIARISPVDGLIATSAP